MTRELTDKQKKFIELIFLPEYDGKEKQAALDAGYSYGTSMYHIYEDLRDEIVKKSDIILSRLLPKTFRNLENVMDDAAQKGAKAKLEAVWGILDRVGVSKKERVEVDVKSASGVFLLPIKQEV